MGITIWQLTVFAAVAETGSVTAAGDRIGLAQSSVSRTIGEIERRLGTLVLERGGRGVKLTATGEELFRISNDLLESWDDKWGRFNSFLNGSSGMVSIASLPSLTREYLAPIVRRFRNNNPNVKIELQDGFSDAIVDRVREGLADFGVTSHPPVQAPLKATHLFSDRMHLVVPQGHPLAHKDEVGWSDIAHEKIITLEHGSSVRPLVEIGFLSIGAEMKPELVASQLVTLGGLVAAGLGVCPLPELSIPMFQSLPVTAIPLVDPIVTRKISLLQRNDRIMNPAAQAFLATLRNTPLPRSLRDQ